MFCLEHLPPSPFCCCSITTPTITAKKTEISSLIDKIIRQLLCVITILPSNGDFFVLQNLDIFFFCFVYHFITPSEIVSFSFSLHSHEFSSRHSIPFHFFGMQIELVDQFFLSFHSSQKWLEIHHFWRIHSHSIGKTK